MRKIKFFYEKFESKKIRHRKIINNESKMVD